jgi:hypothetical protein
MLLLRCRACPLNPRRLCPSEPERETAHRERKRRSCRASHRRGDRRCRPWTRWLHPPRTPRPDNHRASARWRDCPNSWARRRRPQPRTPDRRRPRRSRGNRRPCCSRPQIPWIRHRLRCRRRRPLQRPQRSRTRLVPWTTRSRQDPLRRHPNTPSLLRRRPRKREWRLETWLERTRSASLSAPRAARARGRRRTSPWA